jgi:uncharacterized protein YbbC (DUF1343 family)
MQRYTFCLIKVQQPKWFALWFLLGIFLLAGETPAQIISKSDFTAVTPDNIKVGAEHTEQYLSMLHGRKIAVVANQASLVKKRLLVDTLQSLGINVVAIFAPEHGFYGQQDAGDTVKNAKIPQSSIHIISLYGKHNKPTPEDLNGIDVVVYDIQDVGVRFFTYISTLHLVMEACAENNKSLIVLDRPDPNGYYVDGPVLEPAFKSFSGMDPVPIVYGMTPAEYAKMLNGEKWLNNGVQCSLTCIPVTGYSHKNYYEVPVKPSPNLPTMSSIYLYPSLALFEGTVISVGRGTDKPFEVIGNPLLKSAPYTFTPESKPGAQHPPFEAQKCYGYNLSDFGGIMIKNYQKLYLFWVKGAYKDYPDKAHFFSPYFKNLAGTDELQKQIEQGVPEDEIRKTWLPGISNFLKIRKKYLLYEDFQ